MNPIPEGCHTLTTYLAVDGAFTTSFSDCWSESGRTVERLNSTCAVLGLLEEWDCAIQERTLVSGDMLMLYTDGFTDAADKGGEEFGEQRLLELLLRHCELPAAASLQTIVGEIRQFSSNEQTDDLTLIVAKCTGRFTSAL